MFRGSARRRSGPGGRSGAGLSGGGPQGRSGGHWLLSSDPRTLPPRGPEYSAFVASLDITPWMCDPRTIRRNR